MLNCLNRNKQLSLWFIHLGRYFLEILKFYDDYKYKMFSSISGRMVCLIPIHHYYWIPVHTKSIYILFFYYHNLFIPVKYRYFVQCPECKVLFEDSFKSKIKGLQYPNCWLACQTTLGLNKPRGRKFDFTRRLWNFLSCSPSPSNNICSVANIEEQNESRRSKKYILNDSNWAALDKLYKRNKILIKLLITIENISYSKDTEIRYIFY